MYVVTVTYKGGPQYELDNTIERAGGARNWDGCGWCYIQTGPGERDHSFSWKGEGAARRAYHRLRRVATRANAQDRTSTRQAKLQMRVSFATIDDDENELNPYQSC